MRRTLSSAAIILIWGCSYDPANIGDGPGDNGGTGGGSESGGAGTGSVSPERGGATGNGGTGGGGGTGAGSGGSPSSGGAASRGGAGGTAGNDDDEPGGMGPTDPYLDVIARAAVAIGSCYPDNGVSRNADALVHSGEHMGWTRFYSEFRCIADAGRGCRALDDCLGWTLGASPGCTPGRSCDGDVFRNCIEMTGRDNVEERIDCGMTGYGCDSRAGCIRGAPIACEPLTYVESCDRLGPVTCPSTGVERLGVPCDLLDLVCDPDLGRCTGTGEACIGSSGAFYDGIACAGRTLEACVNGRRQDLDCAMFGEGFSCQSVGGIPFCGVAAECLPANLQGGDRDVSQNGVPEPVCDGTSIVFCNAGRLERVDCTELGFTGCDLEAGLGCVPSPTSDLRP
jgi:hypothetical protein